MDYTRLYNNFMSSRMSLKNDRVIKRRDGEYFERHHIIMKSKGGSNEYDNIVFLTAREHFIAHWILWRIYRDRSSALAFHKMLSKNRLRQDSNRYYSSRGYEEARLAFSETNKGNKYGSKKNRKRPHRMHTKEGKLAQSMAIKGTRIGSKNTFYGKKHSTKTKEMISLAAKERFKNRYAPGKLVFDSNTGIYYDNVKLCSEAIGIKYNTLRASLAKNNSYKGIINA